MDSYTYTIRLCLDLELWMQRSRYHRLFDRSDLGPLPRPCPSLIARALDSLACPQCLIEWHSQADAMRTKNSRLLFIDYKYVITRILYNKTNMFHFCEACVFPLSLLRYKPFVGITTLEFSSEIA